MNASKLFANIPSTSQTKAFNHIEQMADRLDGNPNHYPAQHVNCMSADSKFVTFVNHTIKLALDLTAYLTIWAVLSILLETQDANSSYVQVMNQYHNDCYQMKTRDYMVELEEIAAKPKQNMCNNTFDGVLNYIKQHVYVHSTITGDRPARCHCRKLYTNSVPYLFESHVDKIPCMVYRHK